MTSSRDDSLIGYNVSGYCQAPCITHIRRHNVTALKYARLRINIRMTHSEIQFTVLWRALTGISTTPPACRIRFAELQFYDNANLLIFLPVAGKPSERTRTIDELVAPWFAWPRTSKSARGIRAFYVVRGRMTGLIGMFGRNIWSRSPRIDGTFPSTDTTPEYSYNRNWLQTGVKRGGDAGARYIRITMKYRPIIPGERWRKIVKAFFHESFFESTNRDLDIPERSRMPKFVIPLVPFIRRLDWVNWKYLATTVSGARPFWRPLRNTEDTKHRGTLRLAWAQAGATQGHKRERGG